MIIIFKNISIHASFISNQFYRVNEAFLHQLNLLIMEKYNFINDVEENVSSEASTCEVKSETIASDEEIVVEQPKSISRGSLFCFRIAAATRRFNI